eukprot:2304537-Alexandrium_andersonii.AAC.1
MLGHVSLAAGWAALMVERVAGVGRSSSSRPSWLVVSSAVRAWLSPRPQGWPGTQRWRTPMW